MIEKATDSSSHGQDWQMGNTFSMKSRLESWRGSRRKSTGAPLLMKPSKSSWSSAPCLSWWYNWWDSLMTTWNVDTMIMHENAVIIDLHYSANFENGWTTKLNHDRMTRWQHEPQARLRPLGWRCCQRTGCRGRRRTSCSRSPDCVDDDDDGIDNNNNKNSNKTTKTNHNKTLKLLLTK